jgi:serine/threonine protein kinase
MLLTTIGKFEILAELGRGAMGKVYRARDPVLDRLVALKTVAPGLLANQDTLARFQREARAAAKLQHPNVVTIFELGETGSTVYIAMELLEGMDLSQAMVPPDRFSLEEKIRIMVDVCRGLDYAHKQGVIHRDVKPANIRVGGDGTVKILDFGIARLVDSTLTQTGLVLGTPSYIAPEVLEGGRVDHRTDMWAAGVILYEMLAGRRPYEAKTITGLVYQIVHAPLPPIEAQALPEALLAAVTKALARDPRERFRDMTEMGRALQSAIGLSGPVEPVLDPDVRLRAYERSYEDARRLLAENNLTGALAAARRAQSLDPTRTAIVALIEAIESRLLSAETMPPALPDPDAEPTRLSERTLLSGRPARPVPASPSEPPAEKALPTAALSELRRRGAAVFRELATFGGPPATQAVALSPVKDVLAISGSDGAIRLWDLYSRTKTLTLRTEMHRRTGHDALALSLAWSPGGALLASGHVDGGVHVWDVEQGEEVPVKLRHDALVGALAFSPDGSTLATGCMDSNLRLWDVDAALAGQARRELLRQPAGVTALAYAGGGEWLVTGHVNRILRMLDATTGRLLATLRGPEALVSLLCLSPDGHHLAVASHDRSIRLFDLATREQVAVVAGHRKPATSLSFFADGTHLATVAQDNSVQLWDLEAHAPLAALWGPAEESFTGVTLFGGGHHIAVALGDGRIRVWGPTA